MRRRVRQMPPTRLPRRLGCRWGLRMPGWRLPFNPWFMFDRRHPVVRKTTIAGGDRARSVDGSVAARCGGACPADRSCSISRRRGSRRRSSRISAAVIASQVGGTQLERDASGPHCAAPARHRGARCRRRATVAVAPKAEVGMSGTSLLIASPRAESFRLVDANMTIRIDPDRPDQRDGRRRAAVRHHRAGSPGAIEPAGIAATQAPASPARPAAPIKSPQDNARVFSLQAMTRAQRGHQCRGLARLDRRAGQARPR